MLKIQGNSHIPPLNPDSLIIFSPDHQHSQIAAIVSCTPASAGLMCCNRSKDGKFFGESTSLGIASNRSLSLESSALYLGIFERSAIAASHPGILEAVGAMKIERATMKEIDGVFYPIASVTSERQLTHFFLP